MKRPRSRVRSAVRAHGMDWFTAALAATAVALFVFALARAAGAEHGVRLGVAQQPSSALLVAERTLDQRLEAIAAEFDLYLENLDRTFDRDFRRLEGEAEALLEDYDRKQGQGSRELERRLRALDVRIDQLAKRVGKLRTTMPLPKAAHPY